MNNILLIPDTSAIAHLEENARAGDITVSANDIADLDAISTQVNADGDGVQAAREEGR